jgi:tricorn protease
MGNYDGNSDLYTVGVEGGIPHRVTHHPGREFLSDWTPGGKLLFFGRGMVSMPSQFQLFTVQPDSGLPEQLPVPYGCFAAISPDGEWLAYAPTTRDFATWKRYVGGAATDLWLFNLHDHSAKQITDWRGLDSQPMWHGQKIYYLSDAGPSHRLNIWSYDTETEQHAQITTFDDFDVKWPSNGPGPNGSGEIVFQHGSDLRLLDLATGQSRVVDVVVPGARSTIRPHAVDVSEFVRGADISPSGMRIVV